MRCGVISFLDLRLDVGDLVCPDNVGDLPMVPFGEFVQPFFFVWVLYLHLRANAYKLAVMFSCKTLLFGKCLEKITKVYMLSL